jgi:DNA-binding MarR family transcriptional regulator
MTSKEHGAIGSGLRADPIALAADNWTARGWGDAADGMALVTSIMRVQQVFLARVDAVLRPSGLTFARFEVLRLLGFTRTGTLPVGKIGERLQVHAASVTNAVGRLEDDGLVVRSAHPDDGRSVLVTLTDAGRQLVDECTVALNEQVFAALPVPADQQREVFGALRDIRRAFGDWQEPVASTP